MQRQLRLGDILDDYCPRERRLTNHAVVALVGPDVKQVRCTTCDAEHAYKHAKVPRQRKKDEAPAALYAQVLASGPKRVAPDAAPPSGGIEAAAAQDPPGAPSLGSLGSQGSVTGDERRPAQDDRAAAERAVAAALGVDLDAETNVNNGPVSEEPGDLG